MVETVARRVCRPSITEIDDLVALVKALTDGYLKDNPIYWCRLSDLNG